MMIMNDFPVKIEIRIDWSEIDLFGHINNVAILKHVQTARVNYLEAVGLMPLKSEYGPILASVNCQFYKPLFYPGKITAYSKVDYIKNTSFRIQHQIFNEENELVVEAQDIIVFFDFSQNTKLTIPDEFRKKIEDLEKNLPADDVPERDIPN